MHRGGNDQRLNMEDFFRQNRLEYDPTIFESSDLALDAYTEGACDVFTTDRSALAALRTSPPQSDQHVILPEVISEEPLTPSLPHGDPQVVRHRQDGDEHFSIHAEALGVNSGNVSAMTTGDNVKVKRLLGSEGSWGQADLGLGHDGGPEGHNPGGQLR